MAKIVQAVKIVSHVIHVSLINLSTAVESWKLNSKRVLKGLRVVASETAFNEVKGPSDSQHFHNICAHRSLPFTMRDDDKKRFSIFTFFLLCVQLDRVYDSGKQRWIVKWVSITNALESFRAKGKQCDGRMLLVGHLTLMEISFLLLLTQASRDNGAQKKSWRRRAIVPEIISRIVFITAVPSNMDSSPTQARATAITLAQNAICQKNFRLIKAKLVFLFHTYFFRVKIKIHFEGIADKKSI